ncbi:MAG: thiamine phosphate synthase [Pirellulaceae bacterium]|nr:thiamine phosphate synthase [Pirellulaceae bacterium]
MLSPIEKNRIYRVLDANRNRAIEGLRVLEDFARFGLSNSILSKKTKDFRHSLSTACSEYSDRWLLQRDSQADVGASITAANEYIRPDFASLVVANCSRVSEALRVLEEYSKLLVPELAGIIETLRYEFYELEKSLKQQIRTSDRLEGRQLYVLTSGCDNEVEFRSRMERLVEAGTHVIQLREKNLADGELLQRAKIAVEICRHGDTLFIVNDRPDIAVMASADGVHLGQDEFSVRDVRLLVPTEMLIGISAHSLGQALEAEKNGADYIGVGPTFPSRTKCFSEYQGTALLAQVAGQVDIPAFAIGGIDLGNLSQVIECGFHRVAVSGAIHRDPSIDVISQFLLQLESGVKT